MTKIALLWFDCRRCGRPFMSYSEGQYLRCDNNDHDGICFEDDIIGDIHGNNYLHAVKNERECRKCRKGLDILLFV